MKLFVFHAKQLQYPVPSVLSIDPGARFWGCYYFDSQSNTESFYTFDLRKFSNETFAYKAVPEALALILQTPLAFLPSPPPSLLFIEYFRINKTYSPVMLALTYKLLASVKIPAVMFPAGLYRYLNFPVQKTRTKTFLKRMSEIFSKPFTTIHDFDAFVNYIVIDAFLNPATPYTLFVDMRKLSKQKLEFVYFD